MSRTTNWHAANDSIRVAGELLEDVKLAIMDISTLTLRASIAKSRSQAQQHDASKILAALTTFRSLLHRVDTEVTQVAIAASNTLVVAMARKGREDSEDNERYVERPDSSGSASPAAHKRRAG